MVKRLSVTTLTKRCPMYIYLSSIYPLDNTSLSASFGTWVHGAIAEGIRSILSGYSNISIERLLYLSANNENNPLIKSMMTDKAFRLEAERMVSSAINYYINLGINSHNVMIEKKLELLLKDYSTIIVGILDLGFGNTILDWKTGTFTAEEHRLQLQIYAYLTYKLNIMKPPIEVVDVYLGEEKPKVVKGIVSEKDIGTIEGMITQLIEKSKLQPIPNPSSSCSLCEYKFRCPLYFRLNKESNIVGKILTLSGQLEHAYQYRKLGNEIKSLANKLDVMAQKLIDKHISLKKIINPSEAPPEIIEEKVWTKDILPYLDELTEDEKYELLIKLLKNNTTISTRDIPPKLKSKLFSRKEIDNKKIRKFM